MKDVTLLIQGKINDECFNLWIENYKQWDVVVSIWDEEDLSKYKIPKKWKVVLSSYPKKRFMKHGNLDYQIITTINGLRNTNNNFVIKVRADEYWSNLNLVYELMMNNDEKIISSSMFFRKFGLYDFHCGDKVLAGKKENIELMFNIAYNIAKEGVLDSKVPETYLGLGYLVGKKEILFDDKFVLSLNNKTAKFDRQSAIDAIKSASKAIKKNFDNILINQNKLEMEDINKTLDHCSKIVEYCIGYNKLVEKYKNRIDINDEPYMRKHFEIVDINKLKPYIATRNFGDERGRVWYRDDFNNNAEDCLETLK